MEKVRLEAGLIPKILTHVRGQDKPRGSTKPPPPPPLYPSSYFLRGPRHFLLTLSLSGY